MCICCSKALRPTLTSELRCTSGNCEPALRGDTAPVSVCGRKGSTTTPVSSIQQIAPPALDHVVKECLVKDLAERWQSVSDVVKQLTWIVADGRKPAATTEPAAPLVRRERQKWAAVVGLATILAAGFAAVQFFRASTTLPVVRFQVPPPTGGIFTGANNTPRMSVSPDGQYLAFTANLRDGKADQ